uniref:Uncharacterized protein n=1 Tax=Romanomermis culicivorax TaxID=13658 RepID=A0A915J5K1_ROMCU
MLVQGADMNEKDNEGVTPLMLACLRGCRSTVHLLLAQGPLKIDVRNVDNAQRTALMFACAAGHDAVVQALLEFMKQNFTFEEVQ